MLQSPTLDPDSGMSAVVVEIVSGSAITMLS